MSNSGVPHVQNETSGDFDESEIVSSSIQRLLFQHPHSAASRTSRPSKKRRQPEPTAEEMIASIVDSVDVASEKVATKTKALKTKVAPAIEVALPSEVVARTVDSVCEAVVEPVTEPATEPVAEVPKKKKNKKQKPIVQPAVLADDVSVAAPVAEAHKSVEVVDAANDFDDSPVVKSESDETVSTGGFHKLNLRDEVRQAVEKSGYATPTPIQNEIIPLMLAGRDLLAQSETGSGKTAAFALPILSQIDATSRKTQVLVLAPTRELAIQVANSFSTYGANLPAINVTAIYGGQDYEIQFRQLKRGTQIVVGTPGRVIDHINRGTLDLKNIRCLVLDEADEMLNMGFLEDVQLVLEKIPATRQIALFSATLPAPIRQIADRYLNDPAKITIASKTMTAESIRQRAVIVSPRDKIDVLLRILEVEDTDGVIVFTKTKDATITVADQLNRAGKKAVALNGDMPQKVRERTVDQFKAGHLDILVATDVAARGLDVPRVSHVFNFDLPHDSQSYVHRIGRTGRAGRSGEAIIFLPASARGKLRVIERLTRQPIEVIDPPSVEQVNKVRIRKFKQELGEIIAKKDLSFFDKMVADYVEESGMPATTIAAALAVRGQQGRNFLMENRPLSSRSKRGDGDDRSGRGGSDRQPREKSIRRGGPPQSGMTRYRIEVGWRDGVKPGNIVGAVANEANIDGRDIGDINIQNTFSTIDLPASLPSESIDKLQRVWVSGRQLKIRPDSGPSRHRTSDDSGGARRSFKPRASSGDGPPRSKGSKGFGGKKPAPGNFKKKVRTKS